MTKKHFENKLKKADHEWDKGNLKMAFNLFLEVAENGNEMAQNNLGVFYESGIGIRKNGKRALFWYKKAALQGCTSAMSNIANYYEKQGNINRARFWYTKALERGDAGSSALPLAKLHLKGIKNKRSRNLVIKHLNLALSCKPYETISLNDYEEAQRLLNELSN